MSTDANNSMEFATQGNKMRRDAESSLLGETSICTTGPAGAQGLYIWPCKVCSGYPRANQRLSRPEVRSECWFH